MTPHKPRETFRQFYIGRHPETHVLSVSELVGDVSAYLAQHMPAKGEIEWPLDRAMQTANAAIDPVHGSAEGLQAALSRGPSEEIAASPAPEGWIVVTDEMLRTGRKAWAELSAKHVYAEAVIALEIYKAMHRAAPKPAPGEDAWRRALGAFLTAYPGLATIPFSDPAKWSAIAKAARGEPQ